MLVPLNWRLVAGRARATSSTTPSRRCCSSRTSTPSSRDGDARRGAVRPSAGGSASWATAARRSPREVADDDALLLVYTSGTTGKPKGALLTHANCFWTNLGFDLVDRASRGDDVVLQVLPQFHCGGWNVQPLLAWWKGATRRARARVRRRRAASR